MGGKCYLFEIWKKNNYILLFVIYYKYIINVFYVYYCYWNIEWLFSIGKSFEFNLYLFVDNKIVKINLEINYKSYIG